MNDLDAVDHLILYGDGRAIEVQLSAVGMTVDVGLMAAGLDSAAEALRKIASKPPKCQACGKRKAIKTDGQSRWVCERCAAYRGEPFRHAAPPLGRNEPCPCGSGSKVKHCCKGERSAQAQ